MDIYHVWCDLKPGVRDTTFAEQVQTYLGHLKAGELICGWRLTRRKLGLGPSGIGEFHLMIEVTDLAQLDRAFQRVASRKDPTEAFHFGANSLVTNAVFALYRDFPDSFRHRGDERF
ncbi:MAG TPA: DUF6614 family protein [Acetobacteraceae bacterium]|nr:DUF6614 family protein [Acetobacteraceae bacterium]